MKQILYQTNSDMGVGCPLDDRKTGFNPSGSKGELMDCRSDYCEGKEKESKEDGCNIRFWISTSIM